MQTADVKRLTDDLARNGGRMSYNELDFASLAEAIHSAADLGLVSILNDGGWGSDYLVSLTNKGRDAAGMPKLSAYGRIASYFTRTTAI